MRINCVVLVYDDDRRADDDQEADTDSFDVSGATQPHGVMPHVEMVAPAQTAEDDVPRKSFSLDLNAA